MTNEDRPMFLLVLTRLAEIYQRQLSAVATDEYWDALKDLDAAVFQGAVAAAKRSERFFPTPAAIREQAGGGVELVASRAWESVRTQIRTVGSWGSPRFDELSGRIVRALGGWDRLCASESRELDFIGKEFREMYEQRVTGEGAQRMLPEGQAPRQLKALS